MPASVAPEPERPRSQLVIGIALNAALAAWYVFLVMFSFLFVFSLDVCTERCARMEAIGSAGMAAVALGLLVGFVIATKRAWRHADLQGLVVPLVVAAALGPVWWLLVGLLVSMLNES